MKQRLVTDQMGNLVTVPQNPQRIVSLVPSQTELLYDLGLGDRVVGITKFCIHPHSWFRDKQRIGGTKDVKIDEVKALNPDLIIGNKEENTKEDVEALREISPVWLSDIFSLNDALSMIHSVGELCDVPEKGKGFAHRIKQEFSTLKSVKNKSSKVLYLIWKKPYMGVAADTFIHNILEEELGFTNILRGQDRYPEVNLSDFNDVDYIFLSTEPFPFNESHVKELQAQFPNTKIMLVDGEYFSWYGSRLEKAPTYFKDLLSNLK